jgi:hypothetical protein
MSARLSHSLGIIPTGRSAARRLLPLLLLTPAFIGCESPVEPSERPSPAAAEASATSDSHTLLLLGFDDVLTGEGGEQPAQASGVTFEPGIAGSGALVDAGTVLAYGTDGNFRADAGTIEFWINPRWNGADQVGHVFLTIADRLVLLKDGADNFRFVFRADDSEAYQAYHLGGWTAGDWHYVAVTWTVPGTMRTYVDAVEVIAHPASAQDLVSGLPATLFVGSLNGSETADAVFDQLRISDIPRTPEEIAASYAAGTPVLGLEVQPVTTQPFRTWRQQARLVATTETGTRDYPPAAAVWSSSDPAVASVDTKGIIRALKAGRATITARIGGISDAVALRVRGPVLPVTVEAVAPYLATPAANSQSEVPVVILRYLPTADGVKLDPAVNPDYWSLGDITLEDLKRRLDTFDIRVKFMLEEGTRFRGYQDPAARPALGYRVVALITVHEPLPPGKVQGLVAGLPVYQPDIRQVLERFGGRHYVEDLRVREFWIWQSGVDPSYPSYDPSIHRPDVFRSMWESNMSSPVTGDISNSDRDPADLPVYSRTYMVYGQNLWRTHNEAVHNHGHQLEAILTHVDVLRHGSTELFWGQFVGTLGRVGSTHKPPNTTVDYDYHENYDPVASDIADWTPQGIGQRTVVTAYTWGDHPYVWPAGTGVSDQWGRNESHWYIYWMQSMPGLGNTIPYGRSSMTNWWRFTGNWDTSIKGGLGLYSSCARPIGLAAAGDAVLALRGRVTALVGSRTMSAVQARPLMAKLDAAAGFLAETRVRAAVTALHGFEDRVNALVQGGVLTRRESRTALEGAGCLVERLEAT